MHQNEILIVYYVVLIRVESNVLQQSTKKIPPFMQESEEQTVPSPTTQPYEEVTYTGN